ncbi:GNAT family N-acetyltransferase [Flavobacterium sp. 245]|uniref:GNAT family N-acetyltransferase n=1 Tax=Flavobacterium sp. 245 TaxID=2512115 RepID=UPI00106234B5|nr:GNAT family N-acetyltransferase [Flavobacterium sp. 245]TDP02092.1 ribosomal protein S18 acetylase RimI-like enzyme [Flavobacterium sp. 245]
MTITEIRNKDYESLRNLFLNERQRTFSWLDPSEFQLDDFEKHIQGETVLVALIDDIPVGFISIWIPTNFIHHLYVDQKHQGKNIGTELVKAAIEKTQFPITLKCLQQNSKAIDFYRRKGFVEKEKGASDHGTYILFELLENIN